MTDWAFFLSRARYRSGSESENRIGARVADGGLASDGVR